MHASFNATFCVPANHPSLPGHFPGRPVVPGVVVLDQVLASAESFVGAALEVRGVKQVKFLAPLLPAEEAQVALSLTGESLQFRVTRSGQLIAQGVFVLAASTTP